MTDMPIKVGCVDQEYWYIRKQRCPCGGELKGTKQSLLDGPLGAADLLETTCVNCGQQREFLFDISGFMGKSLSSQKGELMQKCCQGMTVQEAVTFVDQLYISPMAATIMYLMKIAKEKDRLALDYVSEAIEFAKKQAADLPN